MRRALTASRAERRARPDELPSPNAGAALLAEAQRPLQQALARLGRNAARIERTWLRLLRGLKASREEYDALTKLTPGACYGLLTTSQEAYRAAVEARAHMLMRTGAPEGHAIAAVALYLEACLPVLSGPAELRALVRLTSATQRLVATGYGEERAAGMRRLDDRERQKLASDLHDEVGSDLIVLKMYVEAIAMELAKGGAAAVGAKLAEALVLISHAIESVRRLTLDLGPAFLEALGFLPALRSVVRQFSVRTGIQVQLEEPEAPLTLPASHETALYRVLRGALSNVAKHSKAKHVTVSLKSDDDVLAMSVADDGQGFDTHGPDVERGFGLGAMRERIRELHGRLTIESKRARGRGKPSGTRLEVRLPLGRRAA
jgi:signal transduction histidine kinase